MLAKSWEDNGMSLLFLLITLYERQFILCGTAKGWFYNGRLKYNARVLLCEELNLVFFFFTISVCK